MDPPAAEAAFGPDGMTVSSSLGSTSVPWSGLVDRWELAFAWLLFPSSNQFLTVPVEALTPELKALIRAKVPSAGR